MSVHPDDHRPYRLRQRLEARRISSKPRAEGAGCGSPAWCSWPCAARGGLNPGAADRDRHPFQPDSRRTDRARAGRCARGRTGPLGKKRARRRDQAGALYREGDEKGDNAALQQSIDSWQLVLQYRARDLVPLNARIYAMKATLLKLRR